MKKLFLLAAAAVVFGSSIVGCSNTAEGVKADANNDKAVAEKGVAEAAAATKDAATTAVVTTEKGVANAAAGVKNATDNAVATTEKGVADAAAGVKNAADTAGMAVKHTGKILTITPKVKAALLRDDTLYPKGNEPMNKIDVDTTSDGQTIRLSGTVKSSDMKTKAGNIAKSTLKNESETYKIDNELKVAP